jgi:hypothetical protein
MALSNFFRRKLGVALANHKQADDVADAIDAATAANTAMAVSITALQAVATEANAALSLIDVVKISEQIEMTGAVSIDLGTPIPVGGVVLAISARVDTEVIGDGEGDEAFAHIGIGISSDPNAYGAISNLEADAKLAVIPDWAVLASERTIGLYAVDESGNAVTEGFGSGAVTIEICYIIAKQLDDYVVPPGAEPL